MTRWTGFTLSLLLWPPCIFLLLYVVYSQFLGAAAQPSMIAVYVTAAATGIGAWIVPAWKRRRAAERHNATTWEKKMTAWHRATLCLACGDVGGRR
jgi:hypothetical protein